jgi:hypothetical protein
MESEAFFGMFGNFNLFLKWNLKSKKENLKIIKKYSLERPDNPTIQPWYILTKRERILFLVNSVT